MKWQSLPKIVDAEQFFHPATAPRGVRTEEDGRAYVVTIQGQKVYVKPGEWIVEEPDRLHYYPIADDVFRASYTPAPMPDKFDAAVERLANTVGLK